MTSHLKKDMIGITFDTVELVYNEQLGTKDFVRYSRVFAIDDCTEIAYIQTH